MAVGSIFTGFGIDDRWNKNFDDSSKVIGDSLVRFFPTFGKMDGASRLTGLYERAAEQSLQTMPAFQIRQPAAQFTPISSLGQQPMRMGTSAFSPSFFADKKPAMTFSPFSSGQTALQSWMNKNLATSMPVAQNPGGTDVSLGGNWAQIDSWSDEIRRAAAETGVPPSLIKAVMRLESGGVWTDRDPGAGAIGVMQIMPFWGPDLGLDLYDPYQNILAGATILMQGYDRHGNWDDAIADYFGHGCDAYGTCTPVYVQRINEYWQELKAGGATVGGSARGQRSSGLWTITGGREYPITQEHGPSDFWRSNPGMYGYEAAYGHYGHAGIDIGTPANTPLYSPVSGVVVCAGTGSSSGCGAFGSDQGGSGSGRFEIQLDNGDRMIMGHVNGSAVRVGQRVSPGTLVAYSGSAGSGAHVHLEYRQAGHPELPAGYKIVDPRNFLTGGVTSPGAGAPASAPAGNKLGWWWG